MSSQIPWNAPSRYGRAGNAARRLLQRGLRPLIVRSEAEQRALGAEVAAVRDDLSAQVAAARTALTADMELRDVGLIVLGQRLAELENLRSYSSTADLVVDQLLIDGLPPDVRQRRVQGGSSWAICSMGTGDAYRALLARSALSFERYARRWDWDLVLSTEDLADGRPAPWGKIPLLRELLDEYEWLLWLDADVVIVDQEADIRREIRPGKDLHLVEHRLDRQFSANSGVMLIRSGDWARSFLDEVWQLREYTDHQWWENAAVMKLLGYELDPVRLVQPTQWLARTSFMPLRFNSVEIDRVDPPAFVHRGIHDVATRKRHVTGDLACTLGRAHPMTAGWPWPARSITSLADVRRREELPVALNAGGLTGTGLELGVRKGHFSERLLRHWTGNRLISVDSWEAAPADDYVDIANVSQDEHDSNYVETLRRLAQFGPRSSVWRCDGAQARERLRPETLDFVYLDARHDRASVTEDLETWWPMVRPGGVIAGHDYLDGDLPAGVFGVRSAVDEFFAARGLGVHATVDDPPWPSWIVIKPGAVSLSIAPFAPSNAARSFQEALTWMRARGSFVVMQIGAYVGDTDNDPLYRFLSEELPLHPRSLAVLVEPVPEYFEQLQIAYRGWPQVRFENVAIAESPGERDFFRIAVDPVAHGQIDWLTQLGSLREDRMTTLWDRYEGEMLSSQGVEQNFAEFWHANRVVDRVSCVTLEQLLDSQGIVELDLLQIDAEGYDYEILKTLDLARVRPRFINYERVLLHDDEPACRAMLADAGYELHDWGQDTFCVDTRSWAR